MFLSLKICGTNFRNGMVKLPFVNPNIIHLPLKLRKIKQEDSGLQQRDIISSLVVIFCVTSIFRVVFLNVNIFNSEVALIKY